MRHLELADTPYIAEPSPIPIKSEASASPDLLSPRLSSLQHFPFKFHLQHPPPSTTTTASVPSRNSSEPPAPASASASAPSALPPQNHIYRFGPNSGYNNFMSNHSSWSSSPGSTTHELVSASSRLLNGNDNDKFELVSPSHLGYVDDYDDTELLELPEGSGVDLVDLPVRSAQNQDGKQVRRRSSKACDQCRKSKCKCERASPNEPCKSCVMLGTACTFLGPSRKRGPPKGYIDAIEARLHQTEALLGIMISSHDVRAQSLLRDIAKDPLAKEIINRVDNSAYGVKGRKRDGDFKPRAGHPSEPTSILKTESGKIDLSSTHPSNDWQDRVSSMLASLDHGLDDIHRHRQGPFISGRSVAITSSENDEDGNGRRIRRRLGPAEATLVQHPRGSSRVHHSSLRHENNHDYAHAHGYHNAYQRRSSISSLDSLSSADEDLAGAVGELSINEDEQLRYHGKASGLYLLGNQERVDGRNEGGLWRFPKARVWPPALSSSVIHDMTTQDDHVKLLPDKHVQERLLDLYFEHVHIQLPVIHKRSFYDLYNASPDDAPSASTSKPKRVPPLLLFAMFALAARYINDGAKPLDSSTMWEAGDEYLEHAKDALNTVYASSRPSTCQALLLMGYREIGIGAMAQAWTYIGMAIRMAQDLGMHRSADGWARAELGGRLFAEWELHERKRIWYTCLKMDVYVSTYIGRPLMIYERDFDTLLPSEDDPEELEDWTPSTIPENTQMPPPVPARTISCFNASASLATILGSIVQNIYAIRPASSRHAEARVLESSLDKWYHALPANLRYDVSATKGPTPPPHILTLHMQYWCTVLLLHRPFIHNPLYHSKAKSQATEDEEVPPLAVRSLELCAAAANHITSIATVYSEIYTLDSCPNFLCYYVFTASIMHVTILTARPSDPQARMGLSRCMDVLRLMEVHWPSACRALELLRGAKDNTTTTSTTMVSSSSSSSERRKRSAEQQLNDNDILHRTFDHHMGHDHLGAYTSHYDDHATYTATGHEIHPPSSPTQIPYISSAAYDRWHSSSEHPGASHSIGFSGTLSTSVLPQLYSTGLVDERSTSSSGGHRTSSSSSHSHSHHSEHSRTSSNNHHHHHTNRYPQYWNDLQTFSQLGTASYGGYHEPSPATHHQQQQQQHHHHQQSNVYISEPYNLYNPSSR